MDAVIDMTQAPSTTRLKAVRQAIGISQSELSRRTGIDQSLISRAERGRIDTWPRLRASVARALEVPEHILFPDETPR
jgi:transcriptional regulator with XRE-family HTH domain